MAGGASALCLVEPDAGSAREREDEEAALLVARIQSGQEDFQTLYLRYFDRVLAYARVVLRDDEAAWDVAQQTFLRVLEALPRYQRRGIAFRAWLFTIARHATIDYRARGNRVKAEDPSVLAQLREESDGGTLGGIGVEDDELTRAVARLPLNQRQVIVLRYVSDLSYAEIAQLLGRRTDAVRQIHGRALARLRARLEPGWSALELARP